MIANINAKRNKRDLVRTFISILNTITGNNLQLRDINVLTEFCILNTSQDLMFSTKSKKTLYVSCKRMYNYTINSKIMSGILTKLVKHNFLYKQEDKVIYLNKRIRDSLLAINNDKKIKFTLHLIE